MISGMMKKIFLKYILFINKKTRINNCLDIRRILIIRLDEIGDVILSTPFIRELRRNYPKAHISLIVKKEIYELMELCPYVDAIYGYKIETGKHRLYKNYINMKKFIQDNCLEDYDIAVVPRWDFDCGYFSGMFALLSHAIKRIGYPENTTDNKARTDKGYSKFYTHLIPVEKRVKHEAERGLDIIRYMGGGVEKTNLEMWCSKDDYRQAYSLLDYDYENYKKRIALFMSAGANKREWDVEYFKDVIEYVISRGNYQFVLMGHGKSAESKATYIKSNFPNNDVLDLTGKTSLRETYAILKLCDVYLGGDTGPMHMAVAADLAGVVLSCHPITGRLDHYNSPARFGPWDSDKMVVLRPQALPGCENGCIHDEAHCINNISVDDVCKKLKLCLSE